MDRNATPEYARPGEIQALFGICRTSVYELIAAGTFRSVRMGGRRLVDLQSVRKHLESLPSGAAQPRGNA